MDRRHRPRGKGPHARGAASLLGLVALVCVAGFALAGRGGGTSGATGPGEATVVEVVDGDTVVVDLAGSEERVRILGIDTPETHHPDKPVECFGPEAASRTAELLPEGTVVRLERDVELHDRYGRLLAHVVRRPDELRIGNALVEEGYADTLRIPPNTSLSAELSAARQRAREDGRGMWGACPAAATG